MTYYVDIQHACNHSLPFTDDLLTSWAETTIAALRPAGEITIRLVEPQEIASLNHQYRQKNTATNVLAFPIELPTIVQMDCPFLGDVVVCPQVLAQEAAATDLQAHWAHIIIHGVLHLLGYDHIQPDDADRMEAQEILLLAKFGYKNPYSEDRYFE